MVTEVQGKGDKLVLDSAPVENITISYDTLRYLLHLFGERIRRASDWVGPLGIIATLTLTLLVSDFKQRLGMNGEQWQAIAGFSLILAAVWLVLALIRRWHVPTIQNLLEEIRDNSIRRDEWRVLFFLKAATADHLTRLLVFRDIVWDCYVLPHMRYQPNIALELQEMSFRSCIAGYLGLNVKQVSIHYMDGVDLVSLKHSERAKQETTYRFSFYSVTIDIDDQMKLTYTKKTFEIGGRVFSWLTASEMELDVGTLKRNGDLLRHFHGHFDTFFNNTAHAINAHVGTVDNGSSDPGRTSSGRTKAAKNIR